MEYSIMISSLDCFQNNLDKYTRVYFGNEFCPHLQFGLENIKHVVELCKVNKKELTLITSYMTEKSIEGLYDILNYLRLDSKRYEIVANDWGLIYYIKKYFPDSFDIVLGRSLNKIKKTPILSNIFKKLSEDSQLALQKAASNFPAAWELFEKYNIKRAEFENVLQENRFSQGFPLNKTLLYPYVFISNSRRCITDFIFQNKEEYDFNNCKKSCKDVEIYLFNKVMCREVVLKGNTYFYINSKLPSNIEEYSRIVIPDNLALNCSIPDQYT